MAENIFEFKPGVGPFKVDVPALIRRLTNSEEVPSALGLALRFLQVFDEHGVPPLQIQRLLPQVSPDRLKSLEKLLPVLKTDTLREASELLGIQQGWLEGEDECIYAPRFCYKCPQEFWQDLASIPKANRDFPVRALYAGKPPDYRRGSGQPIVLLMLERIAQIGEKDIYRFRVYDEMWDWGHPPCRIQLKATARLLCQLHGTPLPLFRVSDRTLREIGQGKCVPRRYVDGCLSTNPSLEDYALSHEESGVAREVEELPVVLSYIEQNGLEETARSALG